MKKIAIAINGFGRIGRTLFRILQDHPFIEVTAINDLADARTLAHLLKYDSIHGVLKADITHAPGKIVVNGREIPLFNDHSPEAIPWPKSVSLVVEATGKFKTRDTLKGHLKNGIKKVILSVPPEDHDIKMVVLGVNQDQITGEEDIISNASCTTNNAAPMIKVIRDLCGIEQAYITTVHSYTTDQSLHDQPHRDLRRARAAGQSIVPTTTGAAKALTQIFPDLGEVIGGCGIRVPVPDGSLTDITLNVTRDTSIEEINNAFKEAASTFLKHVLVYTEDPVVSVDMIGNPASCTFDAQMTSVIGRMVKIIGWYDNEYGYSSRIVNLIELLSKK